MKINHFNNLIDKKKYQVFLFVSAAHFPYIFAVYEVIKLIESSKETYPHSHIYSLRGTNSNTYAQWVIDIVSNLEFRLPWNEFGKNYKS